MSLYSVVVPVYNSEHTLGELYTRLEKVFREYGQLISEEYTEEGIAVKARVPKEIYARVV